MKWKAEFVKNNTIFVPYFNLCTKGMFVLLHCSLIRSLLYRKIGAPFLRFLAGPLGHDGGDWRH